MTFHNNDDIFASGSHIMRFSASRSIESTTFATGRCRLRRVHCEVRPEVRCCRISACRTVFVNDLVSLFPSSRLRHRIKRHSVTKRATFCRQATPRSNWHHQEAVAKPISNRSAYVPCKKHSLLQSCHTAFLLQLFCTGCGYRCTPGCDR